MSKHQSDSSEQQEAEAFLLKSLGDELGLSFDTSATIPVSTLVQPDAVDPVNKVVVEVYARVGAVKGAQLHKIKGDILKLALIEKELGPSWRKILCFASHDAAKYVQGKSWVAEAARVFGVEVFVMTLPSDQKDKVLAVQERQRMVNPNL